jgi:hypothetical protein
LTPKPQPDYGPSLPDLLRPRLERLGRWQRPLLAGLAVLVVAAVAVTVIKVEAQTKSYTQTAGDARARGLVPISFNFDHSRKLRIFKPPGDYVQAEWRVNGTLAASFSVAPFGIDRQTGLLSGWLPIVATRLEQKAARAYDHFRLQFEGRARVNDVEGYQFAFTARIAERDGNLRQLFGRIVILPKPYDIGDANKLYPPGQGPSLGVKLTMLATTRDNVTSPTVVGDSGILKRPFRSFRFGT